jgi:hypothetical protein
VIKDHMRAALAAERIDELLAQAQAARRAKRARLRGQDGGASPSGRTSFRWVPNWLRLDETREPSRPPHPSPLHPYLRHLSDDPEVRRDWRLSS